MALLTCPHTNLTIPECCCTSCLREQLQRHAPALAAAPPAQLLPRQPRLTAIADPPPAAPVREAA